MSNEGDNIRMPMFANAIYLYDKEALGDAPKDNGMPFWHSRQALRIDDVLEDGFSSPLAVNKWETRLERYLEIIFPGVSYRPFSPETRRNLYNDLMEKFKYQMTLEFNHMVPGTVRQDISRINNHAQRFLDVMEDRFILIGISDRIEPDHQTYGRATRMVMLRFATSYDAFVSRMMT